jgi:MAF protein
LAALAVPYETIPAGIDETFGMGSPAEIAGDLAGRKAEAVARRVSERLILAADTVVALGDRLLGKPDGPEEARAMLQALRGRWHEVTTGVAIIDQPAGRRLDAAVTTRVLMRSYADAEIAGTIRAGTPFDKAGAYAIQDRQFHPVERYEGCYCNVVGLPLWTVMNALRALRPRLACRGPADVFPQCAICPERPPACRRPLTES